MILLCDDDPRVLRGTADALRDGGFEVIACDTGTEALLALSAHPDIILLITDVLMPQMSGPDLMRKAKAIRPILRILFISGDIGETPDAAFAGHTLLPKPFTSAALLKAVEDQLNNGNDRA